MSSKTDGHYIAITQNDKTGKYRYCDSYSLTPTSELKFTPFDKPLPKYIINLFQNVDWEHNNVDYQSKEHGVSTCGRWAMLFCKFRNLSLAQFHAIFKTNSAPYLQQSDNDACLLTLVLLNNITSYLEDVTGASKLP